MILVFLIILNGIFAMTEIALVSSRNSRLQKRASEGDTRAELALALNGNPTHFLSTVQIGITAISVLNGVVGEATLAGPLAEILEGLGVHVDLSLPLSTAFVVGLVTYLTIVIGELVPKRLAQGDPEGLACFMARPIRFLGRLSRPLVYLLTASTDTILKLLGKQELNSINLTEEDIYAMLYEGSEAGVIEKHEHDMVRNVFRLDDRMIVSLMTPRSEIHFLDLEKPFEKEMEYLIACNHSRFPVCRGGVEDMLGIINARRLLKHHLSGERPGELVQHLLPAVYVPESMTGMQLLEQFRESGVQMVFVIDEYGELLGLVTLQDLLEALAGEFTPRNPEDVWAVEEDSGCWLLDGMIPVLELKDRLGLEALPSEDKGTYHTLSGMIMWLLGKVPEVGDETEWELWTLRVVELYGNRVEKVRALPRTREIPAA